MNIFHIRVSQERLQTVQTEITEGSEPGLRFYIMVAVSTLIAGFGLITNSTAVVIGAMLVAPLMTPIFGIALALVRGDPYLMGRAIRAEVAGVAAAVAMGFLLGVIYPALEATPEMIARTQPNLFDLLVAVLAGFAGAYAIVDEKISPALPGVAIATAIVPPLANTGLCFALGAYKGATGSFLLFFANFLSVLLVASAIFFASGMARGSESMKKTTVVRRFGLATVGFILVAGFLSNTLFDMLERRELRNSIHTVLTEELSNFRATGIDNMASRLHEEKLYVLAEVRSPRVFSPVDVERIQKNLSDSIGKPTELIMRTTISNDVSALGSTTQVTAQDLDGFFMSKNLNPNVRKVMLADQIIRDYLSTQLGLTLHDVRRRQFMGNDYFLATIAGIRPLSSDEIEKLTASVRESLQDPSAEVIIRYVEMGMYDTRGRIRYEWTSLSQMSPEQEATFYQILNALEEVFEENEEFFLTNINRTILDGDQYHFLIEVVGKRLFEQSDLEKLELNMAERFHKAIHLHVWSKPEVVVSREGYASYEEATNKFFAGQERAFRGEINRLLEQPD